MKLRAEISDLFRTLNESPVATALGAIIGFGGVIILILIVVGLVIGTL